MSKYYTVVNLIGGHNKKIDAMNTELRTFVNMLITSDESKEIVMQNIEELVRHINAKYAHGRDIKVRRCEGISDMVSYVMMSVGNNEGSVWFHKFRSEV